MGLRPHRLCSAITPGWGQTACAAGMTMEDTPSEGGGMTCLGRTCLKWQADGELTALDLQLVLQRLALVDQDATDLLDRLADDLPCPSLT